VLKEKVKVIIFLPIETGEVIEGRNIRRCPVEIAMNKCIVIVTLIAFEVIKLKMQLSSAVQWDHRIA
jgi:hypothetical protein